MIPIVNTVAVLVAWLEDGAMSMLGRCWRWLEPGLRYADPMLAIGCYELMESTEPPSPEPEIPVALGSRGRDAERHERPRYVVSDRS